MLILGKGTSMSRNKAIMVYTDGACSNNPGGPGGWAATLNYDDRYDVLSGHSISTTNNRMELLGVIIGLEALIKPCDVDLYSDSQYVVKALKYLLKKRYTKIIINSDSAYVVNGENRGWINEWAKKGWKTKQGSDLANADLWKELYTYCTMKNMTIMFNKVAGHSGHTFNEIADEEAKKEVEHAKRILSDNQFSE